MFIILDIVYFVLLMIYLPVLGLKGKLHRGYKMRMGSVPGSLKEQLSARKNIWLHAVSVGEVLAVADLIEKLKQKYPERQLVCSVVTKTGYKIAQDTLAGQGVVVIFAPLDFSFVVRRFIRVIRPEIYIMAETEIWPNLFYWLHRAGVPIIQVNGRISDRSLKGYQKLSWIIRSVLSHVDCFCMQSPSDAERIIRLGASPAAVKIIGNLKFDNLPVETSGAENSLGLDPQEQWLIAGSTHPGEEEMVLDCYAHLKTKHENARLILCPRHVERAADVHTVIRSKRLRSVNLSDLNRTPEARDTVIVVDTIGHLRTLYSVAKVVVIGKTFKVGGGQNMIEPACFGKPVIVGPLTYNFKDVVELLVREKALVQVASPDELKEEITDLWGNAVRRESLGMAARRVVEKYKGATDKTIREIERLLTR